MAPAAPRGQVDTPNPKRSSANALRKKWKNVGEGDTMAFGCGRIAVAYAWHNG